jgi:hypothetical protein
MKYAADCRQRRRWSAETRRCSTTADGWGSGREAGVDVTVDVYPGMQHVFHFLAGVAPEADDAIKKLAHWVRPKLGFG